MERKLMPKMRKHRFQTIFITLFRENVPNVKDFMKNHNVQLFVRLIVVFVMTNMWKAMIFYWKDKRFCITNSSKLRSLRSFLYFYKKLSNEKNHFMLFNRHFTDCLCCKKRN